MIGTFHIEERLPAKGDEIMGFDSAGNKYYCFRCACRNPKCKEWRCSVTGAGLMVDIVSWTPVTPAP